MATQAHEEVPRESKEPTATVGGSDVAVHGHQHVNSDSWIYRERRLGPVTIPYFASPRVQLVMVAFVCFLCPGMFNALSGLGGGGKADHTLGDQMVSFSSAFNMQIVQFLTLFVEHCPLQYLRGVCLLRWYLRQSFGRQDYFGIWWYRLLYLCY